LRVAYEEKVREREAEEKNRGEAHKLRTTSLHEYEKVTQSKGYATLKALLEKNGRLAPKQMEQYESFQAKFLPLQHLAPGSLTRTATEKAVAEFEKRMTELTESEKAQKKAWTEKEKVVEERRKSMKHRPIEQAWEKILAKYKIVYQQYYVQTLIGEHIHRFCDNIDAIADESEVLLLGFAEGLPKETELREEIKVLTQQQRELFQLLDFLLHVMKSMERQSKETIDIFEKVALHYGKLYREYFGKGATPKVHELEEHVAKYLREFERLGPLGEDPIEKLHHTDKDMNYMLRNVRGWMQRQRVVQARVAQKSETRVAKTLLEVTQATSRVWSNETIAKRAAKSELETQVKKQKYDGRVVGVPGVV
jgi:hypothetical protein